MIDLSHIAEGLRGLAVEVDSLHADPANARKGHAVERIAASLRQYGQRKPIVVNRLQGNKVEAGNGTLSAARLLGWSHVAAVFVEDDAATATGFGIADNRTGDLSEWDLEALDSLLGSIDPDEIFTGFEAGELDDLLEEAGKGKKGDGLDAEPQIDRAEELRQEWGVEPGQLWRMASRTEGQEHRLICGDARVPTVIKQLDCNDVAVLLTDPPYSSGGFQEAQRKSGSIGNRQNIKIAADQLSTRGYISLMSEVLALVPADVLYMFTDWRMWSWTYDIAERANFPVRNMLVWDKGRMGMGFPWRSTHELILFAKRTSSQMMDGKTGNVLRFDRASNDDHPTEKPVELVQHILENTPGGAVYDPFGGAGTTMIACENLGRTCRMVEIAPGYVAVALQRYLDAFGIRGELVE